MDCLILTSFGNCRLCLPSSSRLAFICRLSLNLCVHLSLLLILCIRLLTHPCASEAVLSRLIVLSVISSVVSMSVCVSRRGPTSLLVQTFCLLLLQALDRSDQNDYHRIFSAV